MSRIPFFDEVGNFLAARVPRSHHFDGDFHIPVDKRIIELMLESENPIYTAELTANLRVKVLNHIDEDGYLTRTNFFPLGNLARCYPHNNVGLSQQKRVIKHTESTWSQKVNLDMEGSYPQIVQFVANLYGRNMKYTKLFVENREEILKRMSAHFSVPGEKPFTRNEAKRLTNAIFFGGGISNNLEKIEQEDGVPSNKASFECDFGDGTVVLLGKMTKEIRKFIDAVWDHSPELVQHFRDKDHKGFNTLEPWKQKTHVESYVLATVENYVLHHGLVDFLIAGDIIAERSYEPEQDGGIFPGRDPRGNPIDYEAFIPAIERHTLEATGIPMKFAVKGFYEADQDILRLRMAEEDCKMQAGGGGGLSEDDVAMALSDAIFGGSDDERGDEEEGDHTLMDDEASEANEAEDDVVDEEEVEEGEEEKSQKKRKGGRSHKTKSKKSKVPKDIVLKVPTVPGKPKAKQSEYEPSPGDLAWWKGVSKTEQLRVMNAINANKEISHVALGVLAREIFGKDVRNQGGGERSEKWAICDPVTRLWVMDSGGNASAAVDTLISKRFRFLLSMSSNEYVRTFNREKMGSNSFVSGVTQRFRMETMDSDFASKVNKNKGFLPVAGGKLLASDGTVRDLEREDMFTFASTAEFLEGERFTPEMERKAGDYIRGLCLDEELKVDEAMVQNALDFLKCTVFGIMLKIICVMIGETDCGKSGLMSVLKTVLGKFSQTVAKKLFIESRASSAIDCEKAKLEQCRLCSASEFTNEEKLNLPSIKEITGGDVMDYRGLYAPNRDLKPTCNMSLHTNKMPSFDSADAAIIGRIFAWWFRQKFERSEEKRAELNSAEFASIILTYIVKHGNCEGNFTPCELSVRGREEIKESQGSTPLETHIRAFVELRYTVDVNSENKTKAGDFVESFGLYWKEKERKSCPSQTVLTQKLKEYFGVTTKRSGSTISYLGLSRKG